MSTTAKTIRQYVDRLQAIRAIIAPNYQFQKSGTYPPPPLFEPEYQDLYLIHRDEIIDLEQKISNWIITHPRTDFKKSDDQRKYLVTFTYNPNSGYTKDQFKQATIKTIEHRTTWCDYAYAFEHEETNIHCHAILATEHTLNKSNFTSHSRKYGHIDIRIIHLDNGVQEYIKKENNPKFKSDGKLKNNFLDT